MAKRLKVDDEEKPVSIARVAADDVLLDWNQDLPTVLWLVIFRFLEMKEFVFLPHVCPLWRQLAWRHARWMYDLVQIKRFEELAARFDGKRTCVCVLPWDSLQCPDHLLISGCLCCGRRYKRGDLELKGSCGNRMCLAFIQHMDMAVASETPPFMNSAQIETDDQGRPRWRGSKNEYCAFGRHSWSQEEAADVSENDSKETTAPPRYIVSVERTSGDRHEALLRPGDDVWVHRRAFSLEDADFTDPAISPVALMMLQCEWYHPWPVKAHPVVSDDCDHARYCVHNIDLHGDPQKTDCDGWVSRRFSLHDSIRYTEEVLKREVVLPARELVLYYDPYTFRPDMPLAKVAERLSYALHLRVRFEMYKCHHTRAEEECCCVDVTAS